MSWKYHPMKTTDTIPTGRASTLRRWVIHTDHNDVAVPMNSIRLGVNAGAQRSAASA